MRLRLAAILCLFGLSTTCFSASAQSSAHEAADRVTGPIIASARVPATSVHRLATPANDRGRVAPGQRFERMVLLLSGSEAQQTQLTQLLKDQQDAKSAQYHKWLSPQEFGVRFGPSANDLAKVTGWLTAQGFTVEPPANGRRFVLFSGTSAQVERAFATEMHRYSVKGVAHMANSRPASVPAALAGVVHGMASMNTFAQAHPGIHVKGSAQSLSGQGYLLLEPADLSAIYNATPLQTAGLKGEGQTIALIEESNIDPQDVTDFRTLAGLPAAKLNVIVNGPDPGKLAATSEETEAIADTLYAGAFTPNATLNFVVTESTALNLGVELSAAYVVDNHLADVTSLSYGTCETLTSALGFGSLFDLVWEQGAAEGISHFVSSGDNGGDNCERQFPNAGFGINGWGSTPYNVSVGGTEFVDPNIRTYFPPPNYVATGYIPERTWNDYPEYGIPLAGSGGISSVFTKPYWQTGPGVPTDGARDVPDVALVAGNHEGYLICQRDALNGDCSMNGGLGVIGTSLASPTWASIQALVNQKNAIVGGAGNPNPTYYALAAGANSPFHDITVGDIKIPDANGDLVGYAATPGYDLATGLGSVDINKLATGWLPPTGAGSATLTLAIDKVHITHGDTLNAVATLSAPAATGNVVLLAGAQGIEDLPLTGASATFQLGPAAPSLPLNLPGGTYPLTARYTGDATYAPEVSNPVSLTVDPEPSATLLQLSTGTQQIFYGIPETLTAEAFGINSNSGIVAGGTYTFTDGGKSIATASVPQTGENFVLSNASLTNNAASVTLGNASALTAGTHQIAATYPGNASYGSSASTTQTITVQKGYPLVSIFADHTDIPLNTVVNLTANVQSTAPFYSAATGTAPVTGSVTFYDGQTAVGTQTLSLLGDKNGQFGVTFPYTVTTAGGHNIAAVYNGDSNLYASQPGLPAPSVLVNAGGKSSTNTVVLVDPASGSVLALAGTPVSLTAVVTGDLGTAPTGNVTFFDNPSTGTPVVLGMAPVTNGAATLTTSTIAGGFHRVSAMYGGDGSFIGSTSVGAEVAIADFALTPATATATAVAGASTGAVTITYAGNFDPLVDFGVGLAQSVTFVCSGLPTGATCNFSPATAAVTDAANGAPGATTSLVISTTGPTFVKAAVDRPSGADQRDSLVALAGLLAIGLPLAWSRRRRLPALLAVLALAFLGAASGCGGSSTPTFKQTNAGTPAGTTAVTVTATVDGGKTYGQLSHTVMVSLVVTSATGQ